MEHQNINNLYSLAFPAMISNNSVKVVSNGDATLSNLCSLLQSWKTSLFGDPNFGTNLKRYLFEQNSYILADIVIDEIYSTIREFMPQVIIDRKDITLEQSGSTIYARIKCTNTLDQLPNQYEIALITED